MSDPKMIADAAANIADLLSPLKPEQRAMAMKMAEMMIIPAKPRAPRADKGKSRKKADEPLLEGVQS